MRAARGNVLTPGIQPGFKSQATFSPPSPPENPAIGIRGVVSSYSSATASDFHGIPSIDSLTVKLAKNWGEDSLDGISRARKFGLEQAALRPHCDRMFAAVFLILIAILYRVVPVMAGVDQSGALLNFAPMAAIALCGAVFLPRRMAILLPLASLLVSDVVLNVFHYHKSLLTWEIVPHYVALGLVSALGFALRDRASAPRIFGASFAGSVIFYVITNTGSWIGEEKYAGTIAGWFQAMTVGLPGLPSTLWFYRNTLVSDLAFTALFLICHAATTRGTPEPKAVQPALAS